MNRRTLLQGALGATALAVSTQLPHRAFAGQASPTSADYPELTITVTDAGYEFPAAIPSGIVRVTVKNTGTQPSHAALGRLPDGITQDQANDAMMDVPPTPGGFAFTDIGFVGLPDWPAPGGEVTGFVDLAPGNYVMFDPIGPREASWVTIADGGSSLPEPEADATIELEEMKFILPDSFSSAPQRWKITNRGGLLHEIATISVPDTLTPDQALQLLSMPDDATPSPDLPQIEFSPKAAIGILRPQATTWLDAQLAPGRYLALCMLPIPGPMPHAFEGMLAFFDVTA